MKSSRAWLARLVARERELAPLGIRAAELHDGTFAASLGHGTLHAVTDDDDAASRRVLEGLGFVRDGEKLTDDPVLGRPIRGLVYRMGSSPAR